MTLLEPFNHDSLRNQLMGMNSDHSLAFGVACCERLLPGYELFCAKAGWGNPEELRRILTLIGRQCWRRDLDRVQIQALSLGCEKAAPDSEDFDFLYTATAQDTVAAICQLLKFLDDSDIDHIVNAAQYVTDSIDLIVQEVVDMDPGDPELETKILSHPLMQNELRRQERDIKDLQTSPELAPESLQGFISRSQEEQALRSNDEHPSP